MIRRTLDVLGPLHGYGIARRIEETSGDRISLNYGTLYPALLKLEQEGYGKPKWGVSENNRRAKFYSLTPAGRKQLARNRGMASLQSGFALVPLRDVRSGFPGCHPSRVPTGGYFGGFRRRSARRHQERNHRNRHQPLHSGPP